MIIWACIVCIIGLIALLFHIFNLFNWFVPFWGLILMVISFGMLTRIWNKEKEGEKEKLAQRVAELEEQLKQK